LNISLLNLPSSVNIFDKIISSGLTSNSVKQRHKINKNKPGEKMNKTEI